MVTANELAARIELAAAGDLAGLLQRLRERAAPLLERMPPVPEVKALLSAGGGVCAGCGGPLRFDPWEPDRHRCADCDAEARGERHHAHWARTQHLWLAERAAHLATVGVFAGDQACTGRARELLAAYHDLYFALPNRDNVLGPTRLFFSTYLESIWITNYLAAAHLLRERGWLPDAEIEAVNRIADESANLIGEFNEGLSNRQVWNSAALTAIAAWFDDRELAAVAIESRSGLLGLLTDGFGTDGLWHEGENYHLFAVRGLLQGLGWARLLDVDLLANPELAAHAGDALMAPALTALPDLTFPARKDSRFGVSLAHPAYLECWEAGFGRLGDAGPAGLGPWLHELYRTPSRPALTYDAYLHDAGLPDRSTTTRADLSWWMMFAMAPALPPDPVPWAPGGGSAFLSSQRLGVIRREARYASLECGGGEGGHGHPDQLHLTVHAGGVHWLSDPGAGSYLTRDLFWYRSGLAHNAPRLAGEEPPEGAGAAALDEAGEWAWIQGSHGSVRRSVVMGPAWIADLVDAANGPGGRLELPWHFRGEVTVDTPGEWSPTELDSEFLAGGEQFTPAAAGPIRVTVAADGATLQAWLLADQLVRASCPGLPGSRSPATVLLARAEGDSPRLAAVLDLDGRVSAVGLERDQLVVTDPAGVTRLQAAPGTLAVDGPAGRVMLGGSRPGRGPTKASISAALQGGRIERARAEAFRIDDPPALDGTLDGFDLGAPIDLADELHYRRSEEAYEGPEQIAATAYLNWDEQALYLAVEVAKPEVMIRPPEAEPLGLDNDPDDIHSDGIQVYVGVPGEDLRAWLIRPTDDGGIRARPIPGDPAETVPVVGAALIGEEGYVITVALPVAGLHEVDARELEFDLMVNEMRPDRVRRAGQLVFSGGAGWVYLRGDRRSPAEPGRVVLVS